MQGLESIQYSKCSAITRAIKGTLRHRLYQKLGLKSFPLWRWYRKLCFLLQNQNPQYLLNLIPRRHSFYITQQMSNLPFFNVKYSFSKNYFFHQLLLNRINQILNLGEKENLKKRTFQFIPPSSNSLYNCRNPKGIKLMTRICTVLSYFQEHKCTHNFQDSMNPLYNQFILIKNKGSNFFGTSQLHLMVTLYYLKILTPF